MTTTVGMPHTSNASLGHPIAVNGVPISFQVATGWAFALLNGVPYLQFGYFAVGCAPGGGNSNFWTLLLDGNLDLSVTMTFCSNIAALGECLTESLRPFTF